MTDQQQRRDDEALSAYLDDELPRDEADRLTARLAAEPALARRLDALRSADAAARQAFQALDDQPLPQGVLDLLQDDAPRAARARAGAAPGARWFERLFRPYMQLPVAIAASLALLAGFFASEQLDRGEPGETYAGAIPADTALYRLLETGVSSEAVPLADGASGELLLTFEDEAGDYCRQARLSEATGTVQAVACRRAGNWQLEILRFDQRTSATDGLYRAASSGTPAAVDATIDGLIGDNSPLDAEAERRLVAAGWKNPSP